MKNLNPPSNKKFHQGYFRPINVSKYIGDLDNIIYRSSWELKLMLWCDKNQNVLRWSSEPFPIPYYSNIEKKYRRYYVDFYLEFYDNNKNIVKSLVEIKPKKESLMPLRENYKSNKSFMRDFVSFQRNSDKWKYAREFCKNNGMDFLVFTEDQLGIK